MLIDLNNTYRMMMRMIRMMMMILKMMMMKTQNGHNSSNFEATFSRIGMVYRSK